MDLPLCFVIVDSVSCIGYNNEYYLTLVWVSVCIRRKDHSYAPLCKYYSYIYNYHRACCNSRSTLADWLSRRQRLDDFPIAVPDNTYRNDRVGNSNMGTFVCLLWMRTIPQVDGDHSSIFLIWNYNISWGHLSPCSVCTRAYPYLKEIQRRQRRAGQFVWIKITIAKCKVWPSMTQSQNSNHYHNVNDIWNKSYMNCGNEMKMKKWSSQWTEFMQLRKEAWKKKKKFGTSTGFEPVTSPWSHWRWEQVNCGFIPYLFE